MLVLKSPRPSRLRRAIVLASCISGAILAALAAAHTYSDFLETWRTPDIADRIYSSLDFVFAVLLLFFTCLSIAVELIWGKQSKGVFATSNSLAIKDEGKPARYYSRIDICALGLNGIRFEQKNGDFAVILAPGIGRKEIDAFLTELYALWWPGLTLPSVRAYLREPRPRNPVKLWAGIGTQLVVFALIGVAIVVDLRVLLIVAALVFAQAIYIFAVELPRMNKRHLERRFPLRQGYDRADLEEAMET